MSDRQRGVIYAVLAAVAWSTAGILQRQLHVNAATQVAGRGVFGFVALAGYAVCTQPKPLASVTRRGALLAAGAMAVANSAFIVSLNYASVAHVLILQSIAPLVAAGLGVVVLGERIGWRTVGAMLAALAGVIVMVGAPGGGPVLGDGLSLLTGVAFALVIVIARRYRGVSMAPAMALAQLLVVIVFAPFAQFGRLTWADVGWLALLGCGQIGLGAIFFISAARFIPSSEMAMIFLLEVVLGPLWTWIALSETPNVATLVGGSVVILAVGVQVGASGEREGQAMASAAEESPLPLSVSVSQNLLIVPFGDGCCSGEPVSPQDRVSNRVVDLSAIHRPCVPVVRLFDVSGALEGAAHRPVVLPRRALNTLDRRKLGEQVRGQPAQCLPADAPATPLGAEPQVEHRGAVTQIHQADEPGDLAVCGDPERPAVVAAVTARRDPPPGQVGAHRGRAVKGPRVPGKESHQAVGVIRLHTSVGDVHGRTLERGARRPPGWAAHAWNVIAWPADHSPAEPGPPARHRAPGPARCGGRRPDGPGKRTRCRRPPP
jgi:drug/metabolite transporter (DMT)-like permease